MMATRTTAAAAAALIAALAIVGGCKSKRGEIRGVGPWVLEESVRGDFKGICSEDRGLSWCVVQRPVDLGGQGARVALYLAGAEPTSPLTEIDLSVRGCREADMREWLIHKLGDPTRDAGKRLYWAGKHAFISAQIPSDVAQCALIFVAAKDEKRVNELRGAVDGAGADDGAKDSAGAAGSANGNDGAGAENGANDGAAAEEAAKAGAEPQ
jgi:hypothetical protein